MVREISRDRLDEDNPLRNIGVKTDMARTRESLDDIFEFEQNNLEREDVVVGPPPATTASGARVDKTRSLTDEEFETYRSRASEHPALSFNSFDDNWNVQTDELPVEQPLQVFADRSEQAQQTDANMQAEVTTSPEKYASAPGRFDYPFVDTTEDWERENTTTDDIGFPDPDLF